MDREPLRRHALKRLSRLALEAGDREAALRWFGELVGIAPNYLVYASDYVTLAELQLETGDEAAARETLSKGAAIYPRNGALRAMRRERFGEDDELGEPNLAPVSEERVGAHRIPVHTPMITSRTGLLAVIDEATRELRRPGDIVTVGESPAAAGQARIVPLELVEPGPLARVLCRFVGKIGPLHSPEGMQGAIMEAGRAKVLAGTAAAVAGKLARRRGWFYRVAGPGTAMIETSRRRCPRTTTTSCSAPARPESWPPSSPRGWAAASRRGREPPDGRMGGRLVAGRRRRLGHRRAHGQPGGQRGRADARRHPAPARGPGRHRGLNYRHRVGRFGAVRPRLFEVPT